MWDVVPGISIANEELVLTYEFLSTNIEALDKLKLTLKN
jgi:hypothetical protein